MDHTGSEREMSPEARRPDQQELCTQCAQPVRAGAGFCEHCGARIVPAHYRGKSQDRIEEPEENARDRSAEYLAEFNSQESQRLANQLFEKHIGLLKRYRRDIKSLGLDLDGIERTLATQGGEAVTTERTTAIQSVLERLEIMGEQWEDLQLSYNRDSESLDEEFLDRFAELEMDVELPDDLQTKMGRELEVMTRTLDRLGERVSSLGALGNGLIRRAGGQWFSGGSPRVHPFHHWAWALAWVGVVLLPGLAFGQSWTRALMGSAAVPFFWILSVIVCRPKS